MDELKEQVGHKKMSNKSAELAKKKKDIRKRDPEEAKLTAVAVENYFKSAHMTERLSLIKSMAKQCKVPEFVPAKLLFKENLHLVNANDHFRQRCQNTVL